MFLIIYKPVNWFAMQDIQNPAKFKLMIWLVFVDIFQVPQMGFFSDSLRKRSPEVFCKTITDIS